MCRGPCACMPWRTMMQRACRGALWSWMHAVVHMMCACRGAPWSCMPWHTTMRACLGALWSSGPPRFGTSALCYQNLDCRNQFGRHIFLAFRRPLRDLLKAFSRSFKCLWAWVRTSTIPINTPSFKGLYKVLQSSFKWLQGREWGLYKRCSKDLCSILVTRSPSIDVGLFRASATI
jgi:hypothetical protein